MSRGVFAAMATGLSADGGGFLALRAVPCRAIAGPKSFPARAVPSAHVDAARLRDRGYSTVPSYTGQMESRVMIVSRRYRKDVTVLVQVCP